MEQTDWLFNQFSLAIHFATHPLIVDHNINGMQSIISITLKQLRVGVVLNSCELRFTAIFFEPAIVGLRYS